MTKHAEYKPNLFTVRFDRHPIILPVTIEVPKCLLAMCVVDWNRPTDHTLSSLVHGSHQGAFSAGEVNSEVCLLRSFCLLCGSGFGVEGQLGTAGILVRNNTCKGMTFNVCHDLGRGPERPLLSEISGHLRKWNSHFQKPSKSRLSKALFKYGP